MMWTDITLNDGRLVRVHEFGDPAGRPVMFFHGGGLGATGLFAGSCDQVARQQGIRLFAPDRPGMGGSTALSGRKMSDWPGDVAEVADALNIDTFPIVAHSGGAGYALCCACSLRERVTSIHLTSPMVSRSMALKDRNVSLRAKLATMSFAVVPDVLLSMMLTGIVRCLRNTPEKTGRRFLRQLPAGERAVLSTPENMARLSECAFSAFSQGVAGVVDDLRLMMNVWPFPVNDVQQPVAIWHGENDAVAYPQTVKTLADKLLHCNLTVVPDGGHLSTWLCHSSNILKRCLIGEV